MALYREREGWPRAGVANDVSTEYYKSHQGQHLYSNQFVHFWPLEIFLPTGWPNTFPRSTGEGEKKKERGDVASSSTSENPRPAGSRKKAYDSTDRPFSLRTTLAARVERVLVLRRKCFVPVQSSVPVIRLIRKSPLETMRIIYLLGLVIGVTFVSAKHHLWPDVNPTTMSPSIRDESDVQSDDGQSNIASGGYLKNRSRIDTSSQSSKVPSPNINQTSAAEMEAIGSVQKNMSHSTRSNQDHHHRNKHWPVAKGIQQPGRPSTG